MGEEYSDTKIVIKKETLKRVGLVVFSLALLFFVITETKSLSEGLSTTKSLTGNTISNIVNSNVQEINMNIDSSGYSPNSFVLKKGVPVKWNVNINQLTGCNKEIIAKDFAIDKVLKEGANLIEFTPDKTGTFTFSCGMGMLRGSFLITETGTATQQQINSATPSAGHTCGSNGGGCSCGV